MLYLGWLCCISTAIALLLTMATKESQVIIHLFISPWLKPTGVQACPTICLHCAQSCAILLSVWMSSWHQSWCHPLIPDLVFLACSVHSWFRTPHSSSARCHPVQWLSQVSRLPRYTNSVTFSTLLVPLMYDVLLSKHHRHGLQSYGQFCFMQRFQIFFLLPPVNQCHCLWTYTLILLSLHSCLWNDIPVSLSWTDFSVPLPMHCYLWTVVSFSWTDSPVSLSLCVSISHWRYYEMDVFVHSDCIVNNNAIRLFSDYSY